MKSDLLPPPSRRTAVADALRVPRTRRAVGLSVAIALEALLVLALLTLGRERTPPPTTDRPISTFDLSPEAPEAPQPDPAPTSMPQAEVQPPQPSPEPVEPRLPTPSVAPSPSPAPAPVVELPRTQQVPDLRSLPPRPPSTAPRRQPAGPPAPSASRGDSQVVGRAPNGEKLYAAAWYREPYDSELRGYLSTAQGPGWALIACRTVPDFRVEDCVALDEYPSTSRLARAVLAAAWQFRVRPPQVGGQLQIGEWVRIRIDYTQRP